VVDEKPLEATQEPEGLDPETARLFESVRVTDAWSWFWAVISPPSSVVRAHGRAGLSRRYVSRFVGLGTRALGEVFSGEELVECLGRARRSGWGDGPPRSDLARAWCWSAARAQVLTDVLAVGSDEKATDRRRVEAVFAALAFSLVEPGFVDSSPSAAKGLFRVVLEKTATIHEQAIGAEGVRLFFALTRRPLRRRDVARLERLYGGLAPAPAPESVKTVHEPAASATKIPTESLLVKRTVVARALGVAPKTVTAWAKRPGFPEPLWEGNRQCFCAAAVAQWAHENGQVFDLERLPRDLRDRVERARDLLWFEDREAKRKAREKELGREAYVAKKCREDQEQIAEAAVRRAEGRSSA
jgi:hypothetical protein